MITLLIFILLGLIEAAIIFIKWNEMEDLHQIGKIGTKVIGIDQEYNKLVDKFVRWVLSNKGLIWIPIFILSVANLIVAVVLSTIYSIITFFI